MGPGIEAGLGQGGACGPRVAPSVPDVGLDLGQGGGRGAPSVPGTVTDFGLGLGTRGDCASVFWVSLSLLLLQLLCELSLPLLPLLSLWMSLLSDEELCASNSEALGSNTTGWANRHWWTGITRRAGRPSRVSGGAKSLPAASTTAGRGCFFLCRQSLRELKVRRLPKPRTG